MQEEPPELNPADLVRLWWSKRKLIGICTFSGLIVGLAVACLLPASYTAAVKLVAETENASIPSEISGLSSLMGVRWGSLRTDQSLDAALYPEIIGSTPFLTEMSRVKSSGELLSVYLPGLKKRTIEIDPQGPVNREQQKLLESMRRNFRVDTDRKSGLITVLATLRNPEASAVAADSLVVKLERFLITHRIRKARDNFDFISARFEESRNTYYAAQQEYALYVDANRHTARESAAVERERLYQDQQLAYNVYSQLAGQLETARLRVREQTPVLSVIEPAHIPVFKSSPRRSVIVLIGLLLGALLPQAYLFGRLFFRKEA